MNYGWGGGGGCPIINNLVLKWQELRGEFKKVNCGFG